VADPPPWVWLEAMRRTLLVATAAIAALAAVPVAGAIPLHTASPVKVHVAPGSGGPRTTFKLSFHSPTQTGQAGAMRRAQTVEIHGTHHLGCAWSGQTAVPAAVAQQLMHVSLTPGKLHTGARTWCAGTFHGSVVQTARLMCTPPQLCPLIEIRPQTIAQFTFTVKRPS
jgi:hypothetical protein